MIDSNPKQWFKLSLSFHKADTIRILFPLIAAVGVYTAVIAYLELHFFVLGKDTPLRNLSVIHTLLGFALSMLLVFRTNTAYDRWWEGRRLWGTLNNNSRSLALKLDTFLPQNDPVLRQFCADMIANIAFSLKNSLRHQFINAEWEEVEGFSKSVAAATPQLPVMATHFLFQKLVQSQREGLLTDTHLLMLDTEIRTFIDTIGGCERIKNTPIPFSYSVFLKKFIFLYVLTLPFGYAFVLNWYVVGVVMLIFYALASLELIAEEIENPFGTDPNDLPTDNISNNIKTTVRSLLLKNQQAT
jgi:ion channel-forming bestrophin family protein